MIVFDSAKTLLVPSTLWRSTDELTQYSGWIFHCELYPRKIIRNAKWNKRSDQSCQDALKRVCCLHLTDTERRKMLGTYTLMGDKKQDATCLWMRRMTQRWYNETTAGHAMQANAIYEAISMNPGAFVAMIK